MQEKIEGGCWEALKVRKCGNNHFGEVEGFIISSYIYSLWAPNSSFCVKDGTPISTIDLEEDSEEFKKIYHRPDPLSWVIEVDNYELFCEDNHLNKVIGYGNQNTYKFCKDCGKPIVNVVCHESRCGGVKL